MCGIWALLSSKNISLQKLKLNLYDAFQTLKPRGPDRSYLIEYNEPYYIMMGFHRLSIMDPSLKGDQPFVYENEKRIIISICNGEIYNFRELAKLYNIDLYSNSDCEIIHLLYLKIGIERLVKELLGEFAFVIVDVDIKTNDIIVHASRDPFGVRPLFWTMNDNYINFSSELKGLVNVFNKTIGTDIVQPFKPGTYMTLERKGFDWNKSEYNQYYQCPLMPNIPLSEFENIKLNIVKLLIESVKCRLVADRPLGCLLSGGLDSSLVSSIAAKLLHEKGKKLLTFSIGMPGSTDEKYAKLVSEHIGSIHYHISFKEQEWLDAISDTIYATETYDITTIRASTAQYLISKWISKNTDIKVLLIGDGSDELCSGYLYFHKAPNNLLAHYENIRLLEDISYFDVLRADRGISSNGLEARIPFLDIRFVNYYLSVDPKLRVPKNGIEKWLLRESFKGSGYLPDAVLWRPKEAFSDGVASIEKSWYVIIQEFVDNLYSDEQLKNNVYTHSNPVSKEALYYRKLFEQFFSKDSEKVMPYYWLPKWYNTTEPSARTLDIYKKKSTSNELRL